MTGAARPIVRAPSGLRALALPLFLLCTVGGGRAAAQVIKEHPPLPHGHKYYIKIDSSPQQAAVYLDSKDYGIVGYTPYTMRLPRGPYTIILELKGFKTLTQQITVRGNAAYNYTLERQPEPAVLDLEPSPPDYSARGATIQVDGQPVGTVPGTFQVPVLDSSRHQIAVTRDGYLPFTQWLDLGEGEHRTLVVELQPSAPTTGSLLIDADVAGAQVMVDGAPKDSTPALVSGLAVGPHEVEVKKGEADWKQVVNVTGGAAPQKVAASLAGAGAGVTVVTDPPGADLFVDGAPAGKTPAKLTTLAAGQHVVEARLAGYQPAKQTITVDPSAPALVQLSLQPSAEATNGTLSVVSQVPDADVYIDGANVGKAPVQKSVPAGVHYVTVRKDGYQDFKQEVQVAANGQIEVSADLKNVGSLRFIANVQGADVYLDGELIGKTSSTPPLVRESVATGTHVVNIRLPGYYDYKNEGVSVGGGEETIVSADLQLVPTGPTPQQRKEQRQGLASFGARTVPKGHFTADVGTGFPYYMNGRLTVGAVAEPWGNIDAGVEARTFFRLTEIDIQGKLQFIDAGPFAAAAFLDAGGGGGPNGRDTYFTDFGALASLSFGNRVTFSGRAYFNLWDDRLCPNNDPQNPDRVQCTQASFNANQTILSEAGINSFADMLGRYTGGRFMLGATLEIAINELYSVWVLAEGPPFSGPRADYMAAINGGFMPSIDPEFYFSLGTTLKF